MKPPKDVTAERYIPTVPKLQNETTYLGCLKKLGRFVLDGTYLPKSQLRTDRLTTPCTVCRTSRKPAVGLKRSSLPQLQRAISGQGSFSNPVSALDACAPASAVS